MPDIDHEEHKCLNEVLVEKAKAGDPSALCQLWERNKGFISSLLWKFSIGKENLLAQHGLTLEDLENEMFFALAKAVEKFDPEKGGFLSCLSWYIRDRLKLTLWGEHCRVVSTEDGRRIQVSANPLNRSICLDEPAPGFEEDAITRLDLVADPESETPFIDMEECSEQEYIKSTVWKAVSQLSDRQQQIVIAHNLSAKTKPLVEIAADLGISCSRVGQIEKEAKRKLRCASSMVHLRDDVIGAKAYQHTGFNVWKNGGGSVEEWIIENQERIHREKLEHLLGRETIFPNVWDF